LEGESGNLSEVTWGFSPGTPANIEKGMLFSFTTIILDFIAT